MQLDGAGSLEEEDIEEVDKKMLNELTNRSLTDL
jgi:hypothetical protein